MATCFYDVKSLKWLSFIDLQRAEEERYLESSSELSLISQVISNCSNIKKILSLGGPIGVDESEALAVAAFNAGVATERLSAKKHEEAAIRAYMHSEQRKKDAPKGGAATSLKAKKAKALFFEVALSNIPKWAFKAPKQQILTLRKLSLVQDGDGLFMRGGKPLSDSWFKDALSELRQSGELEKAQ